MVGTKRKAVTTPLYAAGVDVEAPDFGLKVDPKTGLFAAPPGYKLDPFGKPVRTTPLSSPTPTTTDIYDEEPEKRGGGEGFTTPATKPPTATTTSPFDLAPPMLDMPSFSEQFQAIRDLFVEQGGDSEGENMLNMALAKLRDANGVFNGEGAGQAAGATAMKTLQNTLNKVWATAPTEPSLNDIMVQLGGTPGELDALDPMIKWQAQQVYTDALSSYASTYNTWLNTAVSAFMSEQQTTTTRLNTVANYLSSALQGGTAVDIERIRQQSALAGQLMEAQYGAIAQANQGRIQLGLNAQQAELQKTLNEQNTALQAQLNEQNAALQERLAQKKDELGRALTEKEAELVRVNMEKEAELTRTNMELQASLTEEAAKSAYARQISLMGEQFEQTKKIMELQTQQSIELATKTNALNMERVKLEQEYTGRQAALDRAIRSAELDEVVRNNNILAILEDKRIGMQERKSSLDFLASMLTGGGLGLFSLAMLSPEMAKGLLSNVGGVPSDLRLPAMVGGPLEEAQKMRTQQDQFGKISIPSLQTFQRASPLTQSFLNQGFGMEGRDLPTEVANLTPASASTRRSR